VAGGVFYKKRSPDLHKLLSKIPYFSEHKKHLAENHTGHSEPELEQEAEHAASKKVEHESGHVTNHETEKTTENVSEHGSAHAEAEKHIRVPMSTHKHHEQHSRNVADSGHKVSGAKKPEHKHLSALAHLENHSATLEVEKQSGENGVCSAVEFPGDGFQKTKITKEEWAKITDQFHEAKRLLHAWLVKNSASFSEKTAALMETQLQDLSISQPPSIEEPDLSWRGIGVWVQDDQGSPVIRLSGGFVKLAMQEPKRSLFELTRLVAQSWAPCELKRVGADPAWAPLLKCLDAFQEQDCNAGSYSEAGWAVSSSLAFELAPPGCILPVFKNSQKSQCLKQIVAPQIQKPELKTPSTSSATTPVPTVVPTTTMPHSTLHNTTTTHDHKEARKE
jgi:hypothetical protein